MKRTIITLLALAISVPAGAAGNGADFLRIDTAARAVSMGSAYTALADGSGAIGYNPAGLASVRGMEVGFTHTQWLMDTTHDFISAAMPLGKAGKGLAIGLGVTRLSAGGIETRNADRSASGSFGAYDQSVSLGLAAVKWGTRVGVGVKYIESAIAGEKARTMAVDLGLSRALGRGPVSVGVSAMNIGAPMRYLDQSDPLPLTVSAGAALAFIPGFNIALDVKRYVNDKRTAISVGSEYNVMPALSLRGGYLTGENSLAVKDRGVSFGAGVNFLTMQLDYSAAPFGELGNTQKISLTKKF